MNPVVNEFSRYALTYHQTNHLQKEIAHHLISKVHLVGGSVLDLGCGSGAVYLLLKEKCSYFMGLDASKEMCQLHPQDENTTIVCQDFDQIDSELLWNKKVFDVVISSSALQWSKEPVALIEKMKQWGKSLGVAIFTNRTFSSLHEEVGFISQLPSVEILKAPFKDGHYEVMCYTKTFSSTRELLEYVKKSGFNGNGQKISPLVLKKVIKENKLKMLEFEVFYGWSDEKSCCSNV